MQIRQITPVLHYPEPDEVPKRRRRKKPKEKIAILLGYTIELSATPDEIANIDPFALFNKYVEIVPTDGAGETPTGKGVGR